MNDANYLEQVKNLGSIHTSIYYVIAIAIVNAKAISIDILFMRWIGIVVAIAKIDAFLKLKIIAIA